jgi:uncharacterized protein (DUF2235 family)
MPKNLAVFLDGSWDTYAPGSTNNSNVGRLYEASVNDATQMTFYKEGVSGVAGGAFGVGLSGRIQSAYNFLVDNYDDGDALYIFGFSRGAYEARSLAGMLSRVGLVRRERWNSTNRNDMYNLAFQAYTQAKTTPQLAENFKATNCIVPKIRMIGVWDTVGALGVPIPLTQLTVGTPRFHDTDLAENVDFAYHAVAIDEQRFDFQPTYWNPASVRPSQTMEQVHFVGVHGDVGGGYDDDNRLSLITLGWMALRAKNAGLKLSDESLLQCADDCCYGLLHNSFGQQWEARGRWPRVIDPGQPFHRTFQKRVANSALAYSPINVDLNKPINYVD